MIDPRAAELARGVAPLLAANAREVDRVASFPEASFAALADTGLLKLMAPHSQGGLEATVSDVANVCQILSTACASTSLCFLMHCCGSVALNHDRAQVAPSRGSAVGGVDKLTTIAFGGEPHDDRLSTDETGEQRLWGVRRYVTGGDRVSQVVMIVNGTMYAIPTNLPQVRFEGSWDGLGMRGSNTTGFVLGGVPLGQCTQLGGAGAGMELRLKIVRPMFLVGLAAIAVGIARAAMEDAAHAVSGRQGSSENAERAVAEQADLGALVPRVMAASDQTFVVASAVDAGLDRPESLFAVKSFACETAIEVSQAAMRIAGGRGYAGVTNFDRYLRDALSGPIMTPTNLEIQMLLGQDLLAGSQYATKRTECSQ